MLRLVCSIVLCGAALGLQGEPQTSPREKDIYTIYSMVMNSQFSSRAERSPGYFIAEKTQREFTLEPCVRAPDEKRSQVRELLADFESRRAASRTIDRRFTISKAYRLLTEEEVKALQAEGIVPKPHPALPDPRFEGIREIVFLSDVFFSKDGKLAMTLVATWCGGFADRRIGTFLRNFPRANGKRSLGRHASRLLTAVSLSEELKSPKLRAAYKSRPSSPTLMNGSCVLEI